MTNCIFPHNPVLLCLRYINNVLELDFKKPNNKLQTRIYQGVEKEKVYKLIYTKQPLIYFTQEIKNNYKVTIK